jgi:hypothetical protein
MRYVALLVVLAVGGWLVARTFTATTGGVSSAQQGRAALEQARTAVDGAQRAAPPVNTP